MNNNNQPRRRTYPGTQKNAPQAAQNGAVRTNQIDGATQTNNTSRAAQSKPTHDHPPAKVRRRVNPIEAARRKKEGKIITAAAVIILLLIALGIALIAKACGANENTNDFSVVMQSKKVVPYSDTVRNGIVYLNAADLAEFCEMTISGSYSELKLSSPAGEYVTFTPSSASAVVNGILTAMPAPAFLDDSGVLWIPCDFISSAFVGISLNVDRDINKITILRAETENSTPQKPIYVEVSFTVAPTENISKQKILDMIASYTFLTDISAYASYIHPTDSEKYLMLVNKSNPLDNKYTPTLSKIDSSFIIYKTEIQLESTAERALEALMKEMRSAGFIDVYVTSGYRTYEYQEQLFNSYISNEMSQSSLTYAEALEKANIYSAKPGESEHHSGLCVDFITSTMTNLDESFADYPISAWLLENAYKFGFVLRYPEDKVAITGYQYEPWHFRFVGQYHATAMYDSDLCLEEYLYAISN